MGKTSLLYKIRDHIFFKTDEKYFYMPVFISLDSIDEGLLWHTLYEKFKTALMENFQLSYCEKVFHPNPESYSKRQLKEDILSFPEMIQKHSVLNSTSDYFGKKIKFVLIVDEAQRINDFSGLTRADLRDILSQDLGIAPYLCAILAGYEIDHLAGRHSSPWTNFMKQLSLTGLKNDEFKTLLVNPLRKLSQERLAFSEKAISSIAIYSKKIPYDAKVFCNLALSEAIKDKNNKITADIVEKIKTRAYHQISAATNGLRGNSHE